MPNLRVQLGGRLCISMPVESAPRPARGVRRLFPILIGQSWSPQEPGKKLRIRVTKSLAVFKVLLLVSLVLAAENTPSTNSTTFSVHEVTTVGQTPLNPGEYAVQAVDGQDELDILQRAKLIGKAACHGIRLSARGQTSEVMSDQGQVPQVKFKGDVQAVQIDEAYVGRKKRAVSRLFD